MEKNYVVVFPEPEQIVVKEEEVPEPGTAEVLIRTSSTLISTGTELTILSASFPEDSCWADYGRFPFRPGYDNIGRVVKLGEGVDGEWLGRRVASYSHHSRYVVRPLDTLRFVHRDELSDEEASFFTIAEICLNGVRRGDVRLGESVVIYGVGLLGQLTARLCLLCGARPIVCIDPAESRLALLPRDTAVVRLNPLKENVTEVVKSVTRGRMADVVFELTGDPKLIPQEFEVLRGQGRFVVLSSPRGPSQFDFHDLCNSPSYTIIGAHNSSHPPVESAQTPWTLKRHAELFFDLVAEGALSVKELISHRIHYKEAPEIYRMLLEDRSRAMGVVIQWE